MIRTITPIFSIILAILIFFLYTQPMFTEVKQVQGEADKYREAAQTAATRNEELNQKYAIVESHAVTDVERLNVLVPSVIDEIKILTDLGELARRHNMLFGNVSVTNNDMEPLATVNEESEVVAFRDLVSTDLQFSLIGTYEQFKSFLADVESSLVLLEVNNIAFTAGEGLFQQYAVSVRVYALPPFKK